MFREFSPVPLVLAAVLAMTGCGDPRPTAASSLLAAADSAGQAGDFPRALVLLDSIDTAYPEQTSVRRQAMHLRPRIIEGLTLEGLRSADSLCAALTLQGDSLMRTLTRVDHPLEPYYTSPLLKGRIPSEATGLWPRMAPDGTFWLVASNLRPVGTTSVSLTAGNREARSAVIAPDGERCDQTVPGLETLTLMQNECDSLCRLAFEHRGTPLTLTFHGRTTRSVPLTGEQTEALVQTWLAAQTVTRSRSAHLEKQRLERQLEIARSQAARTYPD